MKPRVLHYDDRGEGEPLVLLPGALTGWLSWAGHQDRLAASRRVIRMQPMHNELGSAGQTGAPGYTAETERESIRLTLDKLGIDAADFAGWSGGGRAAIELALEYPKRVRTLTLVEPGAYWMLRQLGEHSGEVAEFTSLLDQLAGKDVSEDDLARFLAMAGFTRPGQDPRLLPVWERWVPHRAALSWQSDRLSDPGRSVGELGRIACPTLLVKGTDSVGWLRGVVDGLAARLPNATVVELAGDHACHIQSIDAFLEALQAHLGGTPQRVGARAA
jgi:pimeloyl-ACP methyl ester carboxylesterase